MANPGISVKLSALHPRFEIAQRERVMTELVPRVRSLALQAKLANMGFTIDAEEQRRLALSIDVFEAVLKDPRLHDWDGLGFVVQAYGKRASAVIDHLYQLTMMLDRRITVRLVKGAYWDSEIKHAQVEGLADFPVFTTKAATDISYIANARKLLGLCDRIYPQFATHNAHTLAAILAMGADRTRFEFQRLHGMGENLHDLVHRDEGTHCRIYAPIGVHRDLLAYLVRRLLENGANSSFVNQVIDHNIPASQVAADPFDCCTLKERRLPTGAELFRSERLNSRGFDLTHSMTLQTIEQARQPWLAHQWHATAIMVSPSQAMQTTIDPTETICIRNPSRAEDCVGSIRNVDVNAVHHAAIHAKQWEASAAERARALNRIADLYEDRMGELFSLLAREAGKTLADCVAELREAVDFLRYYAARAIDTELPGVPVTALQYLPGDGQTIGSALVTNPAINGIAFTGSTETAHHIHRSMAAHLRPGVPLIAETGGLNAMLVDSTALPEQAVVAIVESAFKSAGQRCSALRCLYVQEDIADRFLTLLKGAMDELTLGDPWLLATDCGPVIDAQAQQRILGYIERKRREGVVLHQVSAPQEGFFVPPTLIRVAGISDLEWEVFGPVLHVATFQSSQIDQVINDVNGKGYGLTFGLQTRIEGRVQHICDRLHVGNLYVNRNQVGAIVGSQPFGGEGLSGTGPKAGGPLYLRRFRRSPLSPVDDKPAAGSSPQSHELQAALDVLTTRASADPSAGKLTELSLPGPTGESNRLTYYRKGPVLCLGPGTQATAQQVRAIEALGGVALGVSGSLSPSTLTTLNGFSAVLWWGPEALGYSYQRALAQRPGPIVPLLTGAPDETCVYLERHVCVDTTASGGNTELLRSTA